MAKLNEMPEKAGLDLFGKSNYFDNSAQFIKMWTEMATRGIRDEVDLNNLRLSNLTRLGRLKQEQEKAVLDAVLRANLKANAQRRELMEQEVKDRARLAIEAEIAAKKEAGKDLTEEEVKAIEDKVNYETALKIKQIKDLGKLEDADTEKRLKKELKESKKKAKEEQQKEEKERAKQAFGKDSSLKDRKDALSEMFTGGGILKKDGTLDTSDKAKRLSGAMNGLREITNALADFAKQLENQMDEIASKKSAIDTRLQGSSNEKRHGSYWDQMTYDITGFAGVSPLIKQSEVAKRVADMVGQGVAFNVEQRATLDVIKDKIATTFDAANGTLLRLVRIQQQDTTAGRLGMESALTAFLNNMYETTEYMSTLATSVKSGLEEAMSLMTGENALSFEYQIQKWLGSLSSVGMSDSAVQGLAGILGQVAAGKLEGITNGGQGNLVIMAANQAGLNMSDILNTGLDQQTTNILMNSMVDYLAKIYNESGNSKVIQQQIASIYGLSASDLKAAVNLSKSNNIVARDGLDYNTAMGRLYTMAGSMGSRTSLGEQLSNMWNNIQYSMAAGMANNPITYSLFKMSGLLKDAVGGIDFSIPMYMGTGTAQTFNVANLMRAGALSGGIISSLASMISSGGNGGLTGQSILKGIGLTGNGITAVTRGTGSGLTTMGGITVSESGSMVGNAASEDITNKTMTDQTDQSKSETASAADESEETKLSDVDNHLINLIEILQNISDGNSVLKVAIEGGVKVTEMPPGGMY